ncbi:MAG: radical SAM family heme chaperone HemW [Mailhella sp.]|nr:radical SAM family heme chaperone HemW [Mailhella sp.]
MLLYLHVPFCRAKCRYCAFYSRPLGRADEAAGDAEETASGVSRKDVGPAGDAAECGRGGPSGDAALDAWAAALEEDIRLWGKRLAEEGFGPASDTRPRAPRLSSIFFGGGTPSLVPPAVLGRILECADRSFGIESGAEISMEANPESMTPEKAKGFKAAGVNRVSLGVQALDDDLLRAVGRVHSRADALRAFDGLRRAGFDNVGLDFIWGLPGESLEAWCRQLEEAAALGPEHLSCYGLMLEEGTPLWNERESLALPDEATQAAMYAQCGDILEKHGYRQYEISNYARPGRECRHNLGYWMGRDYLGLGPSAVSAMRGQRWSQPADLAAWLAAPRGAMPEGELVETLGPREQAEEFIMLRLRTAAGLPLDEYRRLTGRDFIADNAPLIAALEAEGLARIIPAGEGSAIGAEVLAVGGTPDGAGRLVTEEASSAPCAHAAHADRITQTSGARFALTRAGMLLSNSVIAECFENLPDLPENE